MIRKFARENKEMTLDIVRDLCMIPAPSYMEDRRAEYCQKWLEDAGAKGVYTDSVKNVFFPLNCDGSNKITVIAAHTDTVFPDTECYPEYKEDDERIYCPAVGDDTVRVANVLMCAKYFIENNITPENGVLFVLNSCEEGLGNLLGTRQIFKDYDGRIRDFLTVDANIGAYVDVAVGSHRYEVEVRTEGGHSYSKFGNKNAIAELSSMIAEIYKIEVPEKEGAKTTYNVGTVDGGTSVNTIAQSAKMLCEYRSDDRECLEIMKNKFERIFESAKAEDVEIIINKVGDRPCKGEVDAAQEQRLIAAYAKAVKETTGGEVVGVPASTDANIPMSLGIAALDIGACISRGAHTREEYLEKNSVAEGTEVVIRTLLALI